MRNGLVQLGAWAAATGAAVLLSWLGVHAVLTDASSAHPLPLPLPSAGRPTTPPASLPSGDTTRPSPGATSATPSPTGPKPSPHPSTASATSASATTRPASPQAGSVHSYLVPGGRVALDMKPDVAKLVSATPDPGWRLQYWLEDQWMRFDFSKDGSTNSVFVTWNGHPPDVQTAVG
ncbi:hypothetical protein [Kitasatospora sp. McL0602]|uniref:hypothetical protein n=1 Tax=Kitasatospora sp. McL0602 TaxID=3439530 RepID=UPI003F8AFFB2